MKRKDELKKYKDMKKEDLSKEILGLRKQSLLLGLKVKSGKHSINSDVKKNKKSLARMLTVMNITGENDG